MVSAEYMKRAIELAETARGKTRTNPLVGAVIVKDDRIIAEGFHRSFGSDHAEVDALKNAHESVDNSDLYVTLEPCSHYGKTPPCVEALKSAGIRRVIAATVDPNPKVNGSGIKYLRGAGIEVITGVCEPEAQQLNEVYFKYTKTGLPFVTLKVAQTFDGFIADCDGNSKWISSEESRHRVHQLRTQVDAVLVGGETARTDNPILSSHGLGHDPVRMILTKSGELQAALRINDPNTGGRTIKITSSSNVDSRSENEWALGTGEIRIADILKRAGREGFTHILVEGGSKVFSQFIAAGCVDKYVIVIAPRLMGGGIPAFVGGKTSSIPDALNLQLDKVEVVGGDIWIEAYPAREM